MSTYVLIPGAGGDPWYWHLVEGELRDRGNDAVAVSLPAADDAAGWSEYADAAVSAVGSRPDPIVVAQSFGGFTGPLVCDRLRASMLVFVNAMIPRPGERPLDWGDNTARWDAQAAYLASLGFPSEAADDGRLVYWHDVPEALVAEASVRPGRQSMTPYEQVWPLAAWPTLPIRVLAGRDDRLFPAEFQRRSARDRLGLDVDVMPGGHLMLLSRPSEVADRLEAYATELEHGTT